MGIKTYLEARAYLEELIKPIPYKKVEDTLTSYNPLDRMRTLLALFNNPEKKFTSVQVSGTSGKGSTAYLLSHMLTAAGYKTGFTLSPHLLNITERFQINEQNIPEKVFISLVNELVPVVMKMKKMEVGEPTYFEALMALTFLYFAHEQVDIAVIEVGLEGRYDGTNTLDPLVFILTNISLDHIEYLGDTEGKIAREAMGAIESKKLEERSQKREVTKTPIVITGVEQKDVRQIVKDVCDKQQVPLLLFGKQFSSQIKQVTDEGVVFEYDREDFYLHDLFVSLVGEYQAINATLALEAVFALKQFGFTVTEETIRESLKTAHFPGRFERILITSQHVIDNGERIIARVLGGEDVKVLGTVIGKWEDG
jgi:dihydrofolate synthase/folylpolyglutamate synthase